MFIYLDLLLIRVRFSSRKQIAEIEAIRYKLVREKEMRLVNYRLLCKYLSSDMNLLIIDIIALI